MLDLNEKLINHLLDNEDFFKDCHSAEELKVKLDTALDNIKYNSTGLQHHWYERQIVRILLEDVLEEVDTARIAKEVINY